MHFLMPHNIIAHVPDSISKIYYGCDMGNIALSQYTIIVHLSDYCTSVNW